MSLRALGLLMRFATFAAAIASTGSALAQSTTRDPVAAEALFRSARDEMSAGKLDVACPRFEESYRLDPTPGTLFNLAVCFEKAGKIASAWQRWQQAMDAVGEGDRRYAEAQRHRDDLVAQLPKIVITLAPGFPEDATISKDGGVFGRPSLGVPIPVDPGSHEMVVRLGGGEKKAPFEAVAGVTSSVELTAPERAEDPVPPPVQPTPNPVESTASSESSAQSTVGWVLLGGGGLGFAFFGVTGALIAQAAGTASAECPTTCSEDGQSAKDLGDALLVPNAIGLVAGVVLTGVGVTLVLTDPGEGSETATTLTLGPGGVAASGRF